jgi:FlaA1/EpsC-like NDP-sugar epimerase
VPDKDIKITYTGLRPGEKLYEELLLAEEGIESTNNKKIFIGHSLTYNSEKLSEDIENLLLAAEENDTDKILRLIKQLVPNFSRNSQQ